MREGKRFGMEHLPPNGRWQGTARTATVLCVAYYGKAAVRHVDPDLVSAAGFQPNPDQGNTPKVFAEFIMRDRRSAGCGLGRHFLAVRAMAANQGFNGSPRRTGAAPDEGDIILVDGSLFELVHQAG